MPVLSPVTSATISASPMVARRMSRLSGEIDLAMEHRNAREQLQN
jgi:hypothetical protein